MYIQITHALVTSSYPHNSLISKFSCQYTHFQNSLIHCQPSGIMSAIYMLKEGLRPSCPWPQNTSTCWTTKWMDRFCTRQQVSSGVHGMRWPKTKANRSMRHQSPSWIWKSSLLQFFTEMVRNLRNADYCHVICGQQRTVANWFSLKCIKTR